MIRGLIVQGLPNAIEIETESHPVFSVIWLLGLGADGSDFIPMVPELRLSGTLGVRFIFPHAPMIPVTCNGGYVMRAWYDIITLDSTSRCVDEAGILASRFAIRKLIEKEIKRGIPVDKIFLVGFSQGGAVAYTTALTHPEKLAGLIALSTYVPAPDLIAEENAPANRSIPIFAAHGVYDDVVSVELGLQAKDFLLENGFFPEWHEYPMPHSLCLEEIRDIGSWLRERISLVSAEK